jgi:hypothetical protein
VVYRPHPLSGSRDEPISKANQNIKDFLLSESKRTGVAHLIDASVFGWQLAELDLMITDVSAVAYDWLVTSKPLIITKPADSNALINDAPIFGSLDLLPVDESSAIAQRIEREKQQLAQGGSALKDLREYYFGAAQDFDQQLATALQSALDLHAAELGGQALTEAEPFSSRGAKLGWLRYPNFVLRIGFKLLGKWVGASRRKPKAHTEVLYSHLSDPFNFKSVKPTLDLLWQEAAKSDGSSPLVLATNQISTYLYLHAGFWWRSRKHKLARRLLVIPSISTADAEATLAATAVSEVRHLKHHPFNTMLIRSNSASHVLWLPESDPLFDAGHCVTMYDRVVTSSDAVCEVVDQLVSVARPELQKLP